MNFEKFDFLLKFESYSNTANRLETFGKWPHRKTSKCSAKKVAEAGFYKVCQDSSADDVVCFCCFLELEDWEATDDPLEEHRRLSEWCAYVGKVDEKGVGRLSVEDMRKINEGRYLSLLDKAYKDKIAQLRVLMAGKITEFKNEHTSKKTIRKNKK